MREMLEQGVGGGRGITHLGASIPNILYSNTIHSLPWAKLPLLFDLPASVSPKAVWLAVQEVEGFSRILPQGAHLLKDGL